MTTILAAMLWMQTMVPQPVQEAAELAEVDSIDLYGAVLTTGLEPREYLYQVGHLRRPMPDPRRDPAGYIAAKSAYGWLATCVSRIETGSWTAFYNRTPHRGEHAQGYFGWLPSTARSTRPPTAIMNLDSEIEGFDYMVSAGRGGEFFGIGGWSGRPGSGPCYRR